MLMLCCVDVAIIAVTTIYTPLICLVYVCVYTRHAHIIVAYLSIVLTHNIQFPIFLVLTHGGDRLIFAGRVPSQKFSYIPERLQKNRL